MGCISEIDGAYYDDNFIVISSNMNSRQQAIRIIEGLRNEDVFILEANGIKRVVFAEEKLVKQRDGTVGYSAYLAPLDKTDEIKNFILAHKTFVYERIKRVDGIIDTKKSKKLDGVIPEEALRAVKALDLKTLDLYLRTVKGVINHATVNQDLETVCEYGYDKSTQMFLNSNTSIIDMTVEEAKAEIDIILKDFTFSTPADKEAAIALMLTIAGRNSFDGICPAFLITAPKAGTGKSYLLKCITAAITGKRAVLNAAPKDDEEMRKTMTGVVLSGKEYFFLDNIDDNCMYDLKTLSMAITCGIFSNRMLCKNENVEAPFNSVIAMTGNNINIKQDLARRVIPIRLEERTSTPNTNLEVYCLNNHQRLLSACITLCKQQAPTQTGMYDFQEWNERIGGAMTAINLKQCTDGITDLKEEADNDDVGDYAEFVKKASELNLYSYTYEDLEPLAIEYGLIDDSKNMRSKRTTLGILVKKHKGRYFEGVTLSMVRGSKNIRSFKIETKE